MAAASFGAELDDDLALAAAASDLEGAPALLRDSDRQAREPLVAARRAWSRPSVRIAVVGLALVAAVAAAAALVPAHGAHPAARSEGAAKAAIFEVEAPKHRPKHTKDDANSTEAPPGCCSWDLKHCGKVKGNCRGGVAACERCKGQWIQLHQGTCEIGHSLENPLPRVWNYTGAGAKKHARVKVLSYNLYWWKLFDKDHGEGGKAGHLIKDTSKDEPYDIMGFQECNQPYTVLWDAGMDKTYSPMHTYANICIAYRKKAWELLTKGWTIVAQDASWGGPGQNYGQRMAMWARLRHKETNETVFFMNHHGPLPLSSGGDWGGPATAGKLLEVIRHNATEGDAVIFVGDFNSNAKSMTVKQVSCRLNRIISGQKFGGVDHIFANVADSQVVSSQLLGQGGSDHNALSAVFTLGPQTTHRTKAKVLK